MNISKAKNGLFILLIFLFLNPNYLKAAKPSIKMLEANAKRRQKIKQNIAAAYKWRQCLEYAISKKIKKPSAMLLTYTHLCTYKHFPPTRPIEELKHHANEFAQVWLKLKKRCDKAGIAPGKLAFAIYTLTSSDWEPVSCGRGAGMDTVKNAATFTSWGLALLEIAELAQKKGLDPYILWSAHAHSIRVYSIQDLKKFGLKPPSPPKW